MCSGLNESGKVEGGLVARRLINTFSISALFGPEELREPKLLSTSRSWFLSRAASFRTLRR